MRKGLTELVLIIDSSAAMNRLESELVNGFNDMLSEQQEQNGNAVLTTILYNDTSMVVHDRTDIKAASPLSVKDYKAGGDLALYDAIGTAIQKTNKAMNSTKQEYLPEKVLFVILKCGANTSSWQYTSKMIRELVSQQREKGWEFMMLVNSKNAASQANSIGITKKDAQSFSPDSDGIVKAFAAMSDMITEHRCSPVIEQQNEPVTSDTSTPDDTIEVIPFEKIKDAFTELYDAVWSLPQQIHKKHCSVTFKDCMRLKREILGISNCCRSLIDESEWLYLMSHPDYGKNYADHCKRNIQNAYQQLAPIIDNLSRHITVRGCEELPFRKIFQDILDSIADIYGFRHIMLTQKTDIHVEQCSEDNVSAGSGSSLFKKLIQQIFNLKDIDF
ncbi:MAG: hypothetical protein J6A16_04780 [Oscillospiraceae bacterium]|nr:hypothetical protein [Oscillospiraceae bacterium]